MLMQMFPYLEIVRQQQQALEEKNMVKVRAGGSTASTNSLALN
jgi:hypothetical protein